MPNCAVVFSSGAGQMQVVALREFKAGEEVLMSYIDISLPKAERQADLLKRYGFTCDCRLCARSDEEIDARWCIRHPGCNSQGTAKMPGTLHRLIDLTRRPYRAAGKARGAV